MHLLLPPSEGKQPGGRGTPLGSAPPSSSPAGPETAGPPDRLGAGPLGHHRRILFDAVERVARGPRADAVAAFLLPPAVADAAIAVNATVLTARTRSALDRYTGVVYEGLDAASLTTVQRRVAARSVLVFSGLLGVVAGGEPVPDYRVPVAARIPGIGLLGAFWRPVLPEVLDARIGRRGLVLDLRSSDYAAMWRPGGATAQRVVVVRALSRRPNGQLGVISYFSKHAKGRLARAIVARLADGGAVEDAETVADVWRSGVGGNAEIVRGSGTIRLDLITKD